MHAMGARLRWASLLAMVVQGCFLLDYGVAEHPDAAVDLPEDASIGSPSDGSTAVQDGAALADAGLDLDATASDAQTAFDAEADAARYDAALDAYVRDTSVTQFTDGGLGAGWWTDAAVTTTCTMPKPMPMCDITCNGQNCVFDCGDQVSCNTHCMGPSRCYSDCRGSTTCGFHCDAMSTCSLDCSGNTLGACTTKCDADTVCQIDCSGNASCAVQCDMRATCDVDCRNTTDCSQLKCDKNASCLAYCGATPCAFDCMMGGAMSCPGNIATCNRLCP